MLKYLKNFIYIPLILAIILLFLLFKYNTTRDFKKNNNLITISEGEPDMLLESVRFISTELDKKNLEVTADKARFFRSDRVTFLDNIKAVFHPSEDREWILSGKMGKINMDTMDMEVNEDVIIEFENGYYLSTDTLKYISNEKKVATDNDVKYWGPRVDLRGKGLILEIDEEKIMIMDNVEAELDLKGLQVF